MRSYEIMFIVNPQAPEEEIDKINSQVEGIITSGGGTIEKIEKMPVLELHELVKTLEEKFGVSAAAVAAAPAGAHE